MGCSLIVRNQLCVIGLACIICLLCLHHNHMLRPKCAQLRTCGSAHLHWSVVTGQDGVWGRFLDSGHMLEKVLEKILLVQLMKNQKSDSEDYLTKSNYLNKTYSLQHFACCILEYKYTRSPNTFGVQLPVSQYMSGLFDRPAPIHLWDHNPCQHFQRNRSCLKEGATNCTCILILFFGICICIIV